jgi:enoyl-CoA hydratase/carnithine racemase
MDPNLLRDQLSKLHEELGSVRHVDPRSKQLLAEVLEDIQRLLQRDRAAGAQAQSAALPPGNASLPERLEKVAVQFEADHPTLAASSRRLIDLLGKAGL